MAAITIHPEDGAAVRAAIRAHDGWSGAGGDYPARTLGHVDIGDMSLVLDLETFAQLRDALAAALAEHEAQAAPAA